MRKFAVSYFCYLILSSTHLNAEGVYVAGKTSDFLDKVISEVRNKPEVEAKQKEGYKWPKLSLNIMKVASAWYKTKKENPDHI